MPDYTDLDRLYEVVGNARAVAEAKTGLPTSGITDEEKEQCKRWLDGQDIEPLTRLPGYEILVGKLQTFMEEDIQKLLNTNPSNKDEVVSSHAVAYASHNIFWRFKTEVEADLTAARNVPELVKEGAKITRGIPAESL